MRTWAMLHDSDASSSDSDGDGALSHSPLSGEGALNPTTRLRVRVRVTLRMREPIFDGTTGTGIRSTFTGVGSAPLRASWVCSSMLADGVATRWVQPKLTIINSRL